LQEGSLFDFLNLKLLLIKYSFLSCLGGGLTGLKLDFSQVIDVGFKTFSLKFDGKIVVVICNALRGQDGANDIANKLVLLPILASDNLSIT